MAVLLSSCYSPTERPPERRGVVWPLPVAGSSKRGTPGRLKAAAAAAPRGVRLPPSCRVEAPLAVRLSATGVLACEARREAFSAASRSTILLSCGRRGRQWGGERSGWAAGTGEASGYTGAAQLPWLPSRPHLHLVVHHTHAAAGVHAYGARKQGGRTVSNAVEACEGPGMGASQLGASCSVKPGSHMHTHLCRWTDHHVGGRTRARWRRWR